MNRELVANELIKVAKILTAGKKRSVIRIDWNSMASIRDTERTKARLENDGYKLVQTVGGLTTSELVYEKDESEDIPVPQVAPVIAPDYSRMSLSELARIVRRDWKNVYFGAKPYLDAMSTLNDIKDNYMADSGFSIVAYFLSNATTWRGEVAKAVKKELNKRLKHA